jgi:hypothetical protein
VAVSHGGKPVRDDQHGAPLHDVPQFCWMTRSLS